MRCSPVFEVNRRRVGTRWQYRVQRHCLFLVKKKKTKQKVLRCSPSPKYMTYNWTGEWPATHIRPVASRSKIVAVAALFYLQGEERWSEVRRRGRTTLPHDITILRRVPEIEFCHRSIVTRTRQHSLHLYRRDSAMHSSPLNKLYHGSAGRTGVNRIVDMLLTFSRHPRWSTLKKTSRECVTHLELSYTIRTRPPSEFHI